MLTQNKFALSVLLAVAATLSACASNPDAAPAPASEEKEIRTGSMVPRKTGASPGSTVSKDAFKDVRAGAIKDPMSGR